MTFIFFRGVQTTNQDPLVNVYTALHGYGKSHFLNGETNYFYLWPFSIAMLTYQKRMIMMMMDDLLIRSSIWAFVNIWDKAYDTSMGD